MHTPYDYADTYCVRCTCMYTHAHRLAVVPDLSWNEILLSLRLTFSIPLLAWLLKRSHKSHTASLGGTTNRNINMWRMREKSFFHSLSLFFPSANRLVPNPPGIRGDTLSLIGYIGTNKHMSVANSLDCRRQFLSRHFVSCEVKMVLSEIIEFCQWECSFVVQELLQYILRFRYNNVDQSPSLKKQLIYFNRIHSTTLNDF